MSANKKIEEKDLVKALSTLSDLAKGHNSRGTAATAVESMSGEGGATQVHHTSSNSDPGGWAGSKFSEVSENGASDSIDENGTDLKNAKMMKSILLKLEKGQTLTAQEYALVKGGFPDFLKRKAANAKSQSQSESDVDKAQDCDDDDNEKKLTSVTKSLADEAAGNDTVSAGMEISEFLAEFVGTVSKSLSSMEQRITKTVLAAVEQESARNESFGKSLAGALGALGEGLVANSQRVDQIESTPARGPKSQVALEKSLTGEGEQLSKSIIAATLVDMVEHNQMDAREVIKFDSTGGISEHTMAKVHAYRAGK